MQVDQRCFIHCLVTSTSNSYLSWGKKPERRDHSSVGGYLVFTQKVNSWQRNIYVRSLGDSCVVTTEVDQWSWLIYGSILHSHNCKENLYWRTHYLLFSGLQYHSETHSTIVLGRRGGTNQHPHVSAHPIAPALSLSCIS